MAETHFELSYDGPALETGRMAVRDLAPALLALGELFSDASEALYPERAPVALNIKATERGSFLIQLILEAQQSWDDLIDIFNTPTANALANIEAIILGGGGTVYGLFHVIKRLNGRRVVQHEPLPDPGTIRLTLDDTTTLEIPAAVWRMYQSIEVRKRAREVVRPLARDGIELLTFTGTAVPAVTIAADDVDAFDVGGDPDDQETLVEQELDMAVEIVSPSFKEGNKWRFTDGQGSFTATVEDDEFLARVDRGEEAFRKGDVLVCRMRIVQTRDDEGLHTERSIVTVVDHRPRQQQLDLGETPGAERGPGGESDAAP